MCSPKELSPCVLGVMKDGVWQKTDLGSPQGGVISPLLANIYLDEFDQEMKRRNIRIVRYADDILLFGRTYQEAKEYQQIATDFLEKNLRLVVNKQKTTTQRDCPLVFFMR